MLPVSAVPHQAHRRPIVGTTSNPTVSSGESGDLFQQSAKNPGDFSALLALLSVAKTPDLPLAGEGNGASDPAPAPANPQGIKKTKDDDANATIVAGFNNLEPSIEKPQPAAASQVYTRAGIRGSSSGEVSPPSPAPIVGQAIPNDLTISLLTSSGESLEAATSPVKISEETAAITDRTLTHPRPGQAAATPVGQPTIGPVAVKPTIVPLPRAKATASIATGPSPSKASAIDAKENSSAGTRDAHSQDAPAALNPSLDAARRGEPAQPAAPHPAPAEQIQSTISAHWDQVRHMGPIEVRLDLHPPELGRVQLHLPQVLSFNFGTAGGFQGVTQTGGPTSAVASGQDGYASGSLSSLAIDQDGIINGVFTNGKTLAIAQLALANFANPGALNRVGGNYYEVSSESGTPLVGPGQSGGIGAVEQKQLESSNVDVSLEFTRLIIAQQGYEVNAHVITAANQVLQALTNIIH